MTLKIKRADSKGVDIISDESLGLIILCQPTTHDEHGSLKHLIEDSLDIISSADIFYAWGNASIFIFDVNEFNEFDRKKINDILSKVKHAIVFNGEQLKGNSVNDMYITCGKNEVKIGKKFYTLFTMKKEV